VVKASAVRPEMLTFSGPAVCVDSEDDARTAINQGRVRDGNVIVIRYEGPRGGPGMPEMLSITMMLEIMGLKKTALVTDGRFSGATAGPCVGHVSPEAYEGGPIAALEDGDIVSIDVPNRRIEVKLSEEQIAERLRRVRRVEKPAPGFMRRYRKSVSSACAKKRGN
jgi:dihydroxy-acid dehydratase